MKQNGVLMVGGQPVRSRDIRYSIIGGRKRALTRWYVIKYRTSHTDQPKNRAYKGIEFNLDKETFVKWFQERDFEHASVDRIDKTKGYTMDNIQIIPLIDNIRKDKIKAKNGKCVCYACGKTKELELFAVDKRRLNGHSTICRECDNARRRIKRSVII